MENVICMTIDLKKLPLMQRNRIMDLVHRSKRSFRLEYQIISLDLRTMKYIMSEL